jgi:hypothetical protein
MVRRPLASTENSPRPKNNLKKTKFLTHDLSTTRQRPPKDRKKNQWRLYHARTTPWKAKRAAKNPPR